VAHLLLLVVASGVSLYAIFLAMLWHFQERVVFQPPAAQLATDVPARRFTYRTSDGVELFAYVVGDCATGATTVLAFHGNAELARWMVSWANELARRSGACVVLPEYRGYDGAPGSPTYAASRLDALAALTFTRDTLGVATDRIVYFGHSLGTAIATELASAEPPRSLVLQAPFSSARAMAARMAIPGPAVVWGLISRVHFDTVGRVRQLACPVWVAHGTSDLVIPVGMGRAVFAAARAQGRLLIVDGAGHNDVPVKGGEAYWRWLVDAVAPPAATAAAPSGTRSAP
jgi:pimeloyl-ACP methyl ester carboxylesterase